MTKRFVSADPERIESCEELDESVDINEAFDASVAVGDHAFARMEADLDTARKEKLSQTTTRHNANYEQQQELERARRSVRS